jgi:hypothetical protein
MTSKGPPWTREEMDAKLVELKADPAKATRFEADLIKKTRKAFDDLPKLAAALEAHPIRRKIVRCFEKKAGVSFGSDLHIGFNTDLTHFRFDVWYTTDEQFERDKHSGRHGELAEILREAAREFAQADSEVYFHSQQFVREKCGGNYFNYLR